MNFSILKPLSPGTWVPHFRGVGGGGSNLLCILWPLCVDLDLGPEHLFSEIRTPKPMAMLSRFGRFMPSIGDPKMSGVRTCTMANALRMKKKLGSNSM